MSSSPAGEPSSEVPDVASVTPEDPNEIEDRMGIVTLKPSVRLWCCVPIIGRNIIIIKGN